MPVIQILLRSGQERQPEGEFDAGSLKLACRDACQLGEMSAVLFNRKN